MSDTVRSYARPYARRQRRPSRRGRGLGGGLFVLALLFAAFVWAIWTTRDTHPMGRLIPADQAYEVYVADPLHQSVQLLDSRVWDLLPASVPIQEIREAADGDLGVPDWVINNLVRGVCHISGQDLATFSDPLVVTRMSRVGCLIERLHGFVPGLESDFAGGLHLRALPDAGVFFAVRGRILLASPSRNAVIRALTLAEQEAVGEEELRTSLQEAEGDGLSGKVAFAEEDPLGDVFESLRVNLRVDPDAARLACGGVLRPAWKARLYGLLEGTTPQPLQKPSAGPAMLSMNFERGLPEVWAGLDQALAESVSLKETLTGVLPEPDSDLAPLVRLAEGLAKATGPGMCLSWLGIDQNAMFPMPELLALCDADALQITELFASIPPLPPNAPAHAMLPRYDAESEAAYLPLIGGPSIEPTAGLSGQRLVVSTSHSAAAAALREGPSEETLGQPGNLYLRIHPYPGLRSLLDAALQFAEFGLVRGHTAESLEQAATPWLAQAQQIREVAALAAHEDGEVHLDLRLAMTPAS